jgi:hypothetical protein
VKNPEPTLLLAGSATGLALVAGLILTLRTLGSLDSATALWARKATEAAALQRLAAITAEQRAEVALRATAPAEPANLGVLLRDTLPGITAEWRALEPLPTIPGWTAPRQGVTLTNLTGDELGRFLAAATTANPPWALLECSLRAAPRAGHLARAELVFVTTAPAGH